MIIFSRCGKRENKLDDNSTFEIMEVSIGNFGV
jgi:hypothetical protein